MDHRRQFPATQPQPLPLAVGEDQRVRSRSATDSSQPQPPVRRGKSRPGPILTVSRSEEDGHQRTRRRHRGIFTIGLTCRLSPSCVNGKTARRSCTTLKRCGGTSTSFTVTLSSVCGDRVGVERNLMSLTMTRASTSMSKRRTWYRFHGTLAMDQTT